MPLQHRQVAVGQHRQGVPFLHGGEAFRHVGEQGWGGADCQQVLDVLAAVLDARSCKHLRQGGAPQLLEGRLAGRR